MQHRPEFDLGYSRPQRLAHPCDRNFAGCHGAAHCRDLVDGFDQTGMFHQLHAVFDCNPVFVERPHTRYFDLVDRQTAVAAAVWSQEFVDLAGKIAGNPLIPVTGKKIEKARRPGADFVDQRQIGGQMFAAMEIPQNDVTVG